MRHGLTGLLAPEGDVGRLAACITEVLSPVFPWSAYSARGVELVEKNFDLAKQTQVLEDIYDQTVGCRTAARKMEEACLATV